MTWGRLLGGGDPERLPRRLRTARFMLEGGNKEAAVTGTDMVVS